MKLLLAKLYFWGLIQLLLSANFTRFQTRNAGEGAGMSKHPPSCHLGEQGEQILSEKQ